MNKQYSSNSFVLGVFFLLYATYAYCIGGNTFKYLSLIIGFILLLNSVKFLKNFKSNGYISVISILTFLLLVIVSFVQEQETSDVLYIVFDFVCMCLFLLGYFLSKKRFEILNISNYVKIIIFFFILFGSFYLIKIQLFSRVIGLNSRDVQDDLLNANGIAFITAQLFILISWLIYIEKEKMYKFILGSALTLVLGSLLFTESRGSVLYLLLSMIIFYGFNLRKIVNLKFFIYISLGSLIVYNLLNSIPELSEKIQLTFDRFFKFYEYLNSTNTVDRSLDARKEVREYFYNNYNEMLFGQQYYKPYPHNQFLEIIMRWGIIGLPIFIISIISFLKCIRNIYRKPSKSILPFFISILFIFTYFQSMSSLSLDNNRFLWFGFGFFMGYSNQSKISL